MRDFQAAGQTAHQTVGFQIGERGEFGGEVLPLTHFLRIVRGILLKGNGLLDILPELWPLGLFLVIALTIGIKRYRQTLD